MFPTQFALLPLNAIFTYLRTQNVVRLNKWLSVCLTTDKKKNKIVSAHTQHRNTFGEMAS